ncbi:MAG: DUF1365 domain-containing protein [Asticcacaulis sp.]
MQTGIYQGWVVHKRFAPKVHRLRYQIFQVLFDLDQVKTTRFLSHNRFNLFGFYDRDHGPDQDEAAHAPLKDRLVALLAPKGRYVPGDRLFLLAMPRVLGFVFNPISVYFVEKPEGGIRTVVYEVNNTFGDRHSYVLPVQNTGTHIRQASDKRLHVSPFMAMDMAYEFDLIAPEDTFALKINLKKANKRMLFAGFTATRQPLNDGTLLRLFVTLPFMTLGVVVGIHWEALLLFIKGMRLKPKPPTLKSSVSLSPPVLSQAANSDHAPLRGKIR